MLYNHLISLLQWKSIIHRKTSDDICFSWLNWFSSSTHDTSIAPHSAWIRNSTRLFPRRTATSFGRDTFAKLNAVGCVYSVYPRVQWIEGREIKPACHHKCKAWCIGMFGPIVWCTVMLGRTFNRWRQLPPRIVMFNYLCPIYTFLKGEKGAINSERERIGIIES